MTHSSLARFATDTRLASALLAKINHQVDRVCHDTPLSLMEVCGTHTMAISASGVRRALDPRLKLVSGPGCPVCVTAQEDIDLAIELARLPHVTIATFGDMVRVPGSDSSLEQEAARGADIRVVYSPLDALKLARENALQTVVFLGVGFETTAPTLAAAVKIAQVNRLTNFLVLPLFKTVPEALRTIASAPRIKIDGFMLPGHVSTIIGTRPYEFLAQEFKKPCCVVGFELLDILQGILMLLDQLAPVPGTQGVGVMTPTPHTEYRMQNTEVRIPDTILHSVISNLPSDFIRLCAPHTAPTVAIQYTRSVAPEGNPAAQKLLAEVFKPADANWRGLGCIPKSGLEFRREYERFDVRQHFHLETKPAKIPKGCRCGDVLLGAITPSECRMFARVCTPEKPLGPCMVSSEGACAAYFKYEQ